MHEKRVQGLPITELRHRWAAMNPPALDEDEPDDELPTYLGSEPLDPALADRFPSVVRMPGWHELSEKARKAIIRAPESRPCREVGRRLRALVETVRRSLPRVETALGRAVADRVPLIVQLLGTAGRAPLAAAGAPALAPRDHRARRRGAPRPRQRSGAARLGVAHLVAAPARGGTRGRPGAAADGASRGLGPRLAPRGPPPAALLLAERDPVRRCLLSAGLAVAEELVLGDLLEDLTRVGVSGGTS